MLFLDQANYMETSSSQSEGVRAAVMDPEVTPLPDEYGVDIAPNTRDVFGKKILHPRKAYAQARKKGKKWLVDGKSCVKKDISSTIYGK